MALSDFDKDVLKVAVATFRNHDPSLSEEYAQPIFLNDWPEVVASNGDPRIPGAKAVPALTLRLPVDDYNVLRAEVFVRDMSINEVVIGAIREAIPEPWRRELLHLLEHARATQSECGRPTNIPRNPLLRGARKRSKA